MRVLTPPVGKRDHIQEADDDDVKDSGQGDGASHLPSDNKVTLVEFGDYQCHHCGAAHAVVKALQRRFGARMRYVFRQFPLIDIHPYAEQAAEMAEAAGAQGQFWLMHDMLFEHQNALSGAHLIQYADEIGLDVPRAESDLTQHVFMPRIREDVVSGLRSGVQGTPAFFINATPYDGPVDLESLQTAMENAAQSTDAAAPVS